MFDQLNPVLKSTLALFDNNSLMLSLKYKHGAYLKTSNRYRRNNVLFLGQQ